MQTGWWLFWPDQYFAYLIHAQNKLWEGLVGVGRLDGGKNFTTKWNFVKGGHESVKFSFFCVNVSISLMTWLCPNPPDGTFEPPWVMMKLWSLVPLAGTGRLHVWLTISGNNLFIAMSTSICMNINYFPGLSTTRFLLCIFFSSRSLRLCEESVWGEHFSCYKEPMPCTLLGSCIWVL